MDAPDTWRWAGRYALKLDRVFWSLVTWLMTSEGPKLLPGVGGIGSCFVKERIPCLTRCRSI